MKEIIFICLGGCIIFAFLTWMPYERRKYRIQAEEFKKILDEEKEMILEVQRQIALEQINKINEFYNKKMNNMKDNSDESN